jgi:hypothetical protein
MSDARYSISIDTAQAEARRLKSKLNELKLEALRRGYDADTGSVDLDDMDAVLAEAPAVHEFDHS